MKRFFEPTKGGRRAQEQRAKERHEMEMAILKQQKEMMDKFYAATQHLVEPLTQNLFRSFGIDPQTGRYALSSATLMRLGETGAALRNAEAETAALLASQGVDPQTIAKMQANMRQQAALQLADQAMRQRQEAFAQAHNMIAGIFGMGGQVRHTPEVQMPPPSPFNPFVAIGSIANSIANIQILKQQQKLLQQQMAQQQMAQPTPNPITGVVYTPPSFMPPYMRYGGVA